MDKVLEITKKYFSDAEIESAKVFDKRAIISLKSDSYDENKEQKLQDNLLHLDEVEKVSIVYTNDKKPEPIMPKADKWPVKNVKKIIAVASGKGGVGKSTTAVNLALALANEGLNIALFDADIHGPSIPLMLGIDNTSPLTFDGKTFEPFKHMGIQTISIGNLIDKSQPLIWRGIKAAQAIEQLMVDVNWKDVDLMVIDMPPGTGDIQITLSQKLNLNGAIIVSTPQDIALIDAIKGVNMFKMVNIPILGIVENMSYYICENCGTRADIFGHEGAAAAATGLGVDFLGEIPLHISIRQNADQGTPIVMADPDSPYAKAYADIAQKIKHKLKFN